MTDKLRIGLNQTTSIEVSEAMLAENVGSGDTAVLATPMLINLVEMLCTKMISENLEDDGYTSVGTLANIKHLAPTPAGITVTAKATVIGLDRRKVTFRVEVHDESELIGTGIHERVIVNRDKFNAKAAAKRK